LPKLSRTYSILNRSLGKALHTYDMIADGDRIAVGLSGGKDSWALLWALSERQQRIRVRYKLFPIYIDPGFGGETAGSIERFMRNLDRFVHIEYTDHGVIAQSDVNRENPCFLCSRLRRQRLFELADEFGCNKVALGHHKDDLIETFFLNMLYAGEVSTMNPYQPFFKGKLTVIRPLAYTDEDILRRFAREMAWPIKENLCPSAGTSKRAGIKSLLQGLYRDNKKIRGNIFRAMRHVRPEYLIK
jgi:tRNA 2-thiocytidine biosynthesis protein TtcA